MSRYRLLILPSLLLLGSCGEPSPSPLAVHDTKYRNADTSGNCVEDTITGLIWEVKTDRPGLHHWRNTYTWYNPEEAHDDLDYRGLEDGGECTGSKCDTWDFVVATNTEGHCGYSDWRMPSRDELYSISDLRKASTPPTANLEYFPHMQPDEYWTGYDYGTQHESAWAWNFFYGHDRVDWKKSPKFVRLVRGTSNELEQVKE